MTASVRRMIWSHRAQPPCTGCSRRSGYVYILLTNVAPGAGGQQMPPCGKNPLQLQEAECGLMSLSDLTGRARRGSPWQFTAQCREVLEQSQMPNQEYGIGVESRLWVR